MPYAELNGIRLYHEVHGRGFPLVLLRGFAGTAQSWARQVAALSARYRLILYAARGDWRSESPKDPRAIAGLRGRTRSANDVGQQRTDTPALHRPMIRALTTPCRFDRRTEE